jgi:hypothetical protein
MGYLHYVYRVTNGCSLYLVQYFLYPLYLYYCFSLMYDPTFTKSGKQAQVHTVDTNSFKYLILMLNVLSTESILMILYTLEAVNFL